MNAWLIFFLVSGVVYFVFRDAINKGVKAILYEMGLSKDDGGGACDSRY